MNRYLYELDNGSLVNIKKLIFIGNIRKICEQYTFTIAYIGGWNENCFYNTEDEAKIARNKLIEKWSSILDIDVVKSGIYETRAK